MLARLDLELIHHLLYIGNLLGELLGFFLLVVGLHRAGENEGSILGLGVDTLLVESLVRLDGCLEVIFDSTVDVGSAEAICPWSPGGRTPISLAIV